MKMSTNDIWLKYKFVFFDIFIALCLYKFIQLHVTRNLKATLMAWNFNVTGLLHHQLFILVRDYVIKMAFALTQMSFVNTNKSITHTNIFFQSSYPFLLWHMKSLAKFSFQK